MSEKKISLIGLGEIGSRHLQALTKGLDSYELHCVDPSQASIEFSKSRLPSISPNHESRLNFYTEIDSLPAHLDLAIIATSSNVRLGVLEQLSKTKFIKNLILEKVLFQKLSHLKKAERILNDHKISAWVNCPRRQWPIYQEVRQLLLEKKGIKFYLSGQNWGLACNSIHYLDIFGWMSSSHLKSIDISELDRKILKSKRQGFVEFAGTISATFTNHNKMSLTSTQKQQDLLVEIESEGLKIKINESTGDLEVISDENSYSKSFLLPYQSDLTNLYVEQILGKHEVSLPDYSYSSAQHSTMLKAFIDHLSGINKRHIEHCPIT
tara:strand:- start:6754 stop:7722 length:969 start_codon:yes stop_codon:yes gene_type:complete